MKTSAKLTRRVVIFAAMCLSLAATSCGFASYGRVIVTNSSNSEVTNFTLLYNTDRDEADSGKIARLESGKSKKLTVQLNEMAFGIGGGVYTTEFAFSYMLSGTEYMFGYWDREFNYYRCPEGYDFILGSSEPAEVTIYDDHFTIKEGTRTYDSSTTSSAE